MLARWNAFIAKVQDAEGGALMRLVIAVYVAGAITGAILF